MSYACKTDQILKNLVVLLFISFTYTLLSSSSVFAGKLLLNRTHGAGNNHYSIDPAEVFTLRPDTYFWAYSQAQRYRQASVTYSRTLAPRL